MTPAPDASGPIPAVDIYAEDYIRDTPFEISSSAVLDWPRITAYAAFKAGWAKAREPGSTIDNEIDETIDYPYVDHLINLLELIDDSPAREALLRRLFESLGVDWPERETKDEKPESVDLPEVRRTIPFTDEASRDYVRNVIDKQLFESGQLWDERRALYRLKEDLGL